MIPYFRGQSEERAEWKANNLALKEGASRCSWKRHFERSASIARGKKNVIMINLFRNIRRKLAYDNRPAGMAGIWDMLLER